MDTINHLQALLEELKAMESSDQKQLDELIAQGERFLALLVEFANDN